MEELTAEGEDVEDHQSAREMGMPGVTLRFGTLFASKKDSKTPRRTYQRDMPWCIIVGPAQSYLEKSHKTRTNIHHP